jgi:hypothetical protein
VLILILTKMDWATFWAIFHKLIRSPCLGDYEILPGSQVRSDFFGSISESGLKVTTMTRMSSPSSDQRHFASPTRAMVLACPVRREDPDMSKKA